MMRRFVAALTTLSLLIVSTPGLFARPIQVRRTWDELSRMIPGMNIRIVLPDTTRVEGPVLDVHPDVLVMEVRRTSDPRRHAKGRTQIPRSDVSTVGLLARRPPGSHPGAGPSGGG